MKKRRPVTNDENTLLVVTSYPDFEATARHEMRPVTLHAGRILTNLSKTQNIVVAAQVTGLKKTQIENKQLTVMRMWEQGNPFSLFRLLPYLIRNDKIRNILIQFDFDTFGGFWSVFASLPLLLGLLRLYGKHIYFELHQIPFEMNILSWRNRFTSSVASEVFDRALVLFYRIIGLMSDKIIVFEEDLKERLSTEIDPKKMTVLPVGITPHTPLPQSRAKHKIGMKSADFTALSFGLFDWNKGTDWIAQAFANTSARSLKLLLAGGKNPALRRKKEYQAYCRTITRMFSRSSRLNTAGFVGEKEIELYFSAADVVVLPYREFISHSSALNYALSFGKPVIFSDCLIDYTKSPDFAYAMQHAGLGIADMFFPLEEDLFIALLQRIRTDKILYKKLVAFSRTLAKKRDNSHIIRDYKTVVSRAYAVPARFAFNIK